MNLRSADLPIETHQMEQVWGCQLRHELVLSQLLSSFRNAYAGTFDGQSDSG